MQLPAQLPHVGNPQGRGGPTGDGDLGGRHPRCGFSRQVRVGQFGEPEGSDGTLLPHLEDVVALALESALCRRLAIGLAHLLDDEAVGGTDSADEFHLGLSTPAPAARPGWSAAS